MIQPRRLGGFLSAILLAAASPALAQGGPEQLDQIEPGAGEWQAEYYGAFGGDGEQGVEALVGISDHIALGAEVEFEGPRRGLRFESASLVALARLLDPEDHPLGVAIKLRTGIDGEGRFAGAESRLILESRRGGWWLQADAILRHLSEDGEHGTGVAYGASIQRSLGGEIWLGVEASGQLARLAGSPALAREGQHYAGPSLTVELPVGKGDVELGIAWLQRLRGEGPGSGARLFAQFTF